MAVEQFNDTDKRFPRTREALGSIEGVVVFVFGAGKARVAIPWAAIGIGVVVWCLILWPLVQCT